MRVRARMHDGWHCHVGELAVPPARGSSKAGGCGSVSDLVADELPMVDPGASDLLAAMIPGWAEASPSTRPPTLGPGWVDVRLPHDWRIEQAPSPHHSIWQAFLPAGVAYYRRRFTVHDPYRSDRRKVIEFEGVMRDSTVWCNGFLLGDHLSGYTGFRYDLTELLRYGGEGENVLLVRCDTTTAEGWWYEGGGIYRNVRLITLLALHVELDGVHIMSQQVQPDGASVVATIAVRNDTGSDTTVRIRTSVIETDGAVAATASTALTVPAFTSRVATTEVIVANPRVWRVGDGQLYDLITEVESMGAIVDRVATTFGIRTVDLRPDGLFVNGEHARLQGANIHQDFAGTGVALPDRLHEYKLTRLVEMGCNAVRTAHHPPAPALLDAADRLGLLVVAENRLMSTAPPYLEDLEAMVVAGRNHPSVFLWSLENEEYLEGSERGARILETLVRAVRRLDPTRPTAVGGARNFESPFFDVADVVGAHYQALNNLIDDVQALRPSTPLIADEEGLYPTVRGQYDDDVTRGMPSSFGTAMGLYGAFPAIVATLTGREPVPFDVGATWQWFMDHHGSAGAFVWAGIDYLGEPTPMRWPVMVSNYGAMDLCGFPKDYYWLLRSYFRSEPMVYVLPHWTWPGLEGKPLRLWVYSNCDEVELAVNGAVIGRRSVVNHIAKWDDGVIYEPGSLVARGLRRGRVVAHQQQETAGLPRRLICAVEPHMIAADGDDVAVVTVAIVDSEGRICPWADHDLVFDVAGPGILAGVGNGDPTSLEPHKGRRRRAFRGRALAIVRSIDGAGGAVDVRASADTLHEGCVSFATTPNLNHSEGNLPCP